MTMKVNKVGKHKRIIIDSSDSESDNNESKSINRKSSRISQKLKKPKFQLPSRDEIWKKIPTVEGSSSLNSLIPKKNVNNLTKIYSDYNFDDYEDTSDSMSSTESFSEEDIKTNSGTIRNYYSRITQVDSSDEEQKTTLPVSDVYQLSTPLKDPEENNEDNDNGDSASQTFGEYLKEDSSEDGDELTTTVPKRSKRKRYSLPDSE
ncbi:NAD-dependent protein deacetylase HST1 [Biomphalaria pfeifferi]|uniref:NAD-dependent protein deacetylase HST1 n=1 Tax=Biomphalaria pfeifferi TaxID=112525 RepID=A0AAD8EYY6_BIOPF|nr:NAD-dependent protein deacetylase HST1 [Biomphalaria pfeifferi]